MIFKFSKMQCCGNDFMFVDGITQKAFFSPELIRKLADRHFGIGFDQLILVEPPFDPEVDFHFRIFNSDGTEVQIGANAAACFINFVIEHKLTAKNDLQVSSASRLLQVKLNDDGSVCVNAGAPSFAPEDIPYASLHTSQSYPFTFDDGLELSHSVVSMGNPHAVFFVDDLNTIPLEKYGKEVESSEMFPEKVNVTFAKIENVHEISLKIFERGCGVTMANGTCACAACVSGITSGKLISPVKVKMPGGEAKVEWNGGKESVLLTVSSISRVFDGTFVV
jgi:diaminopimelate epimerase